MDNQADMILYNGKVATQDERRSFVEAIALREGRVLAVGTDRDLMRLETEETALVRNPNGRTAIPGLNDSHPHPDPRRPQL